MYNERDPVTLEEMETDAGVDRAVQAVDSALLGTPTPSTPPQGFVSNFASPIPGTPRPQNTPDDPPTDFMPGQQMASMFGTEAVTRVEYKSDNTIGLVGDIALYKANLAVEASRWPVQFVACGPQVELFSTDGSTDLAGAFLAEPSEVTAEMRHGANRPASPHDINTLQIIELCGEECLAALYDDGRTGIWTVGRIMEEVQEGMQRYLPHVTLLSDASVWGASSSGTLLAVSDNSRRVDIYDFAQLTGKLTGNYVDRVSMYSDPGVETIELPRYRSPLLMNNIPSISLVVHKDCFYVTAATIGYEVATMKFFTGKRLEKWQQNFADMDPRPFARSLSSDSLDSIADATDESWEDSHIYRPFEGGLWIHRNSLGTHVWSVTTVHPRAFKQSPTLYEVHANKWASELQVAAHLKNESKKAVSVYDEQRPFYPAVRFTHYDIPTCPLQPGGIQPAGVQALAGMFPAMGLSTPAFNYQPHYVLPQCKKEQRKTQQWYERYGIDRRDESGGVVSSSSTASTNTPLRPGYSAGHSWDFDEEDRPLRPPSSSSPYSPASPNELYTHEVELEKKESPLKDLFLIVTTRRSIYLCRHDDLYVNGACANVFSWEDIYGVGEQQFDRLCFAHYIPDLCVFICGSPIGAVSVFRLTKKAGVFCMRQEWAFPDTSQILFSADRLRLLAGVAVSPIHTSMRENIEGSREKQWHEPCLRYRITLIYCDGYRIQYELSGDKESTWMV